MLCSTDQAVACSNTDAHNNEANYTEQKQSTKAIVENWHSLYDRLSDKGSFSTTPNAWNSDAGNAEQTQEQQDSTAETASGNHRQHRPDRG